MKSKIIIGDIHGQLDALIKLLAKLPGRFSAKDICFSGDLIDRGPESRTVIDLVKRQGFDVCMGNHEDFMITNDSYWRHPRNGGHHTYENYRKDNGEIDDEALLEHRKWISSLPLYLEYNDIVDEKGRHLVVSHSSIQKVWRFRDSSPDSGQWRWFHQGVLWERNMNAKAVPDVYNVFGHSPQENGPKIREDWACIDGGSFATWEPGYGKLIALQFPEMIVYEQEVEDKSYENYLREKGVI